MSRHSKGLSLKPKRPKTKLGLPDLDRSKSAVLDSLGSPESKRGYRHAIDEFIQWYCSEPRLSFNKVVVTRFRITADLDQAFVPEFVEVMRKSRVGDAQFFLNLSDYETLRVGRQQELHNPQSRLCSHCGEHVGISRHLFSCGFRRMTRWHISMFAEI